LETEAAIRQNLQEDEKRLLEEIQLDIPLVVHPFKYIGKNCGMSEKSVIEKLRSFSEQGMIRELSAIFNASGLGYKSTLIAVKAGEDIVNRTVERINSHPGVSHNYLRNNEYNIWFTMTIKRSLSFDSELKKLFYGIQPVKYIILPAIETFKIGVQFPFTGKQPVRTNHAFFQPEKAVTLSEPDKRLVLKLQEGLPVVKTPWEKIAENLQIDEETLFLRIRRLKEAGVIKRISAVLRHRKLGFRANGMACFRVPDNRIAAAGRCLAKYREVSHCYQRKTYPDWQYALFAMVHKNKEEECLSLIEEMALKIECRDFLVLFSEKEFKKERVKYFVG